MISEKQNEERQLQRLAAQRQLYATAKVIFGWQLFLSGLISVILAIAVILNSSFKIYAASCGVIITLADIFILTRWQKNLKDSAARIQETFDCDILELPWNDLKAGKKPEPEIIKEQSDKYAKWATKMPPLTDWYAKTVDDLPIHIGRIACQRENIYWDSKQRRRYATYIISIVILIVLIIFGLSIKKNITITDFIVKTVAPLFPMIILGVRQYIEQTETATRLDRLKDHADKLWKEALSGKYKNKLTSESRNLQDEILEHRKKSPFVFDFIYKQLRSKYEETMNYGVKELVFEAKKKGKGIKIDNT